MDFEKVLDAITDEVSIVSVLNPNNPIGTAYTEGAVRADRIEGGPRRERW